MKNMHLTLAIVTNFVIGLSAQEAGKPFPAWKEGEMEIHHIYTGRGEGVFCLLPDGTTLLIDPGDAGPHSDPRTTPSSPDASRQPGEWIARYISRVMTNHKVKKIDYAFLTHFHDDHMGGVYKNTPKTKKGGDYFLSGLPEVFEHIPYAKMVDRGWPDYNFPRPLSGKAFQNYKNFIDWNVQNNTLKTERFLAGSNTQFVLVNKPDAYKGIFEIRNIVSAGEIWTGEGNTTKKHFPEVLPPGQSLDENKCSAGIRITYGDFDYFNGGDLSSRLPLHSDPWRDIETPVGKAVGQVEVCEANHHAWIDAMSESFLNSVQPQIIIMQVWHVTHLNLTVMNSMTNKGLNRHLQYIFPTAVPDLSKAYLGDDQIRKITGDGGHVVIRVAQGGKSYTVSLLTANDESMTVKSIYGPINCF